MGEWELNLKHLNSLELDRTKFKNISTMTSNFTENGRQPSYNLIIRDILLLYFSYENLTEFWQIMEKF